MIRLEKSRLLQRTIRQDDMTELEISSWTLCRNAITAGQIDKAFDFIDYACGEGMTMHDGLVAFVNTVITHLATFDERLVEKVLRERFAPRVTDWLSNESSVEDFLYVGTYFQRSHYSNFTLWEESDRYVVKCDPCGSGGRLRRAKNTGVTKKAYPWSWSKKGIPYFCAHCCIMWEIVPIELRGFPIRVTIPGDRAEDPCVHHYYKKPELIPPRYFRRVGLKAWNRSR